MRFNLQFTLTVEHDQDVWIQPLQNQSNPKERNILTVTTLYDAATMPTKRKNMQYGHRDLQYVKPMLAVKPGLCFMPYGQTGFCYRLKAGNYFVLQGFMVPTQRKYMIRVIGNGVTLNLLE